jgi:hypothetical protein
MKIKLRDRLTRVTLTQSTRDEFVLGVEGREVSMNARQVDFLFPAGDAIWNEYPELRAAIERALEFSS